MERWGAHRKSKDFPWKSLVMMGKLIMNKTMHLVILNIKIGKIKRPSKQEQRRSKWRIISKYWNPCFNLGYVSNKKTMSIKQNKMMVMIMGFNKSRSLRVQKRKDQK